MFLAALKLIRKYGQDNLSSTLLCYLLACGHQLRTFNAIFIKTKNKYFATMWPLPHQTPKLFFLILMKFVDEGRRHTSGNM